MYLSRKKALSISLGVFILLFSGTGVFAGIEGGKWELTWMRDSGEFETIVFESDVSKKKAKKLEKLRIEIGKILEEADKTAKAEIGAMADKSKAKKALKKYASLIKKVDKLTSNYLKAIKKDEIKKLDKRKETSKVLKDIFASIKDNYEQTKGLVLVNVQDYKGRESIMAADAYQYSFSAISTLERSIQDVKLVMERIKQSGYTLDSWKKMI